MQKKKSGVKKCLEILPLRGGGGGRQMANAILNFHFDFLNPSLIWGIRRCYFIFDGLFYEDWDKENGEDKDEMMIWRI